ncbi:DUF4350 domain-containing protein [Actinoplanes sp. NPDC051411]|uniref:DUF4350 domain-containing protein n=1 Tax=Actinoplanes sp. NPDC051411 TaxID=3155522 RepID=UPI00342215E0
MTTTATRPSPAPSPSTAKRKRNWRWLRLAVPVAVVIAVFIATAIVHTLQQADPGDKNYLDPGSPAAIGSSRLADALRGQGITVTRVTTTYQASSTLWARKDATLFVTAPAYTDVEHLTESKWFPPGSHIVLVRADDSFLQQTDWPASTAGERWTASAPAPGCDLFEARAAVHKRYYKTSAKNCYQGGVVEFGVGPATVDLVGAADPFRNDRLDEHDNRAFALSLLGRNRQVIWLDRHDQDKWPTSDGPVVTDRPAPDRPDDSTADDSPEATTETPEQGDGGGTAVPQTPGDSGGSGQDGQQPTHQPDGEAQQARHEADTFPPQVWGVVLLVLLALAAFAAASARRLGTPVAERLPSRVPANETMLGHARLYHRGGSRGPSLRILKQTARRRITEHLGLHAAATDEALADASGLPVERFTEVFSANRRLRRDSDLVAATRQLQDLMRDVLNTSPGDNEGDNQ